MSTLPFASIPLFNLGHFTHGTAEQRSEFVVNLRNACHNIGFFYLKNHGVDPNLMERVLKLTSNFFDLPQPIKEAVQISQSPHYRGYGKLGEEITLGLRDYKETFDLGLEQAANLSIDRSPYHILQGPNQWPLSDEFNASEWRETLLHYIHAVRAAGKQVMQAMALALALPENFFANQFADDVNDAYAIFRLLRYPPGRINTKDGEYEIGVGRHTDAGCLVFLLQDSTGGLQVQNCAGEWIDAPPIKDTYVVNIGEMLQLWSNNYFLATPHRVINTSRSIRHSAPFFLEPNLDTWVAPLTLSSDLLASMERPEADKTTRVLYGEHMLSIYQRSFQTHATTV